MTRVLSNRIKAIEYVHALDGQTYRHTYKPGSAIELERSGNLRVVSPRGVRLWDTYEYKGREQQFLKNAPGGARSMAKRKRKTGARRKANGQFVKRTVSIVRNKPRKVGKRRSVAKRSTKRRRVMRRNPKGLLAGFSLASVLETLKDGALGGVAVTVGEYLAETAALKTSFDTGSVPEVMIQAGAGVLGGFAFRGIVSDEFGLDVMKGGFATALKAVLGKFQVANLNVIFGATSGPPPIRRPQAAQVRNADARRRLAPAPRQLASYSNRAEFQPMNGYSNRTEFAGISRPGQSNYPTSY